MACTFDKAAAHDALHQAISSEEMKGVRDTVAPMIQKMNDAASEDEAAAIFDNILDTMDKYNEDLSKIAAAPTAPVSTAPVSAVEPPKSEPAQVTTATEPEEAPETPRGPEAPADEEPEDYVDDYSDYVPPAPKVKTPEETRASAERAVTKLAGKSTKAKEPEHDETPEVEAPEGQKTPEELEIEKDEARRVKPDNINAAVKQYQKLVNSMARHYAGKQKGDKKAMIDDLTSAGHQGIMKAMEKFDAKKDKGGFGNFVSKIVKNNMWRELTASRNAGVYAPERDRQDMAVVRKAEKQLTASLGRDPSPEELANHLGITADELEYVQQGAKSASGAVSADDTGGDEEGPSIMDTLGASDQDTPEEAASKSEIKQTMRKVMAARPDVIEKATGKKTNHLTDMEEKVVTAHLGLDGPPLSGQQIGTKYGFSRERARQITASGLEKFKDRLKAYGMDVDFGEDEEKPIEKVKQATEKPEKEAVTKEELHRKLMASKNAKLAAATTAKSTEAPEVKVTDKPNVTGKIRGGLSGLTYIGSTSDGKDYYANTGGYKVGPYSVPDQYRMVIKHPEWDEGTSVKAKPEEVATLFPDHDLVKNPPSMKKAVNESVRWHRLALLLAGIAD